MEMRRRMGEMGRMDEREKRENHRGDREREGD